MQEKRRWLSIRRCIKDVGENEGCEPNATDWSRNIGGEEVRCRFEQVLGENVGKLNEGIEWVALGRKVKCRSRSLSPPLEQPNFP